MAGITLAQAEAQLSAWLDASTAVARNQRYRIGERELTRADASEIREQVKFWDDMVKRLDRGGIRVRLATPV